MCLSAYVMCALDMHLIKGNILPALLTYLPVSKLQDLSDLVPDSIIPPKGFQVTHVRWQV